MANAKITQLPALTTADPADLLCIVDDVAGTPVTKKITLANFFTSPTLVTPVLGVATATSLGVSGFAAYTDSPVIFIDTNYAGLRAIGTSGVISAPGTDGIAVIGVSGIPTTDVSLITSDYVSVTGVLGMGIATGVNASFVEDYGVDGRVVTTGTHEADSIYPLASSSVLSAGTTLRGDYYGVGVFGAVMNGATFSGNYYGVYQTAPDLGGGSIAGTVYAYHSESVVGLGAHNYFLYYGDATTGGDANGAGAFRVDSLGIMAYYNPAFAAYTPGATNFEREIMRWGDTGVFGTDDNAYFGVEAGGTGTNRQMNILGSSVHAMTVPGTYAAFRAASLTVTSGTTMVTSTANFSNGAAASIGTLTNAPSAGNPSKWIPINDNGTTRYIPAWT